MNLASLLSVVAIANIVSFGSGTVMLGILQTSLVTGAHALTNQQLLYAFAIARVTPGQANLYVAAIGFMLYGLPGAVLCSAAIALPSYSMLPLMRGYGRLRENAAVYGFTRGLASTATGIVAATTLGLVRDYLGSPLALSILALSLGLMLFTRIPTVVAMLGATGVGVVLIVGAHVTAA